MANRPGMAPFLVVLALHAQANVWAEETEADTSARASLLSGLASDNPREAEAAERRLARAGPNTVVLLRRLKVRIDRFLDMDRALQNGGVIEARKAIRFFAERNAFSYVLKALRHPRDDIKLAAAQSVVAVPKKEVAAALIRALDNNKDRVEGSDEVMMRRELKRGLVSAIGKVLSREYALDDPDSLHQIGELIHRMKQDLGDSETSGPGEESTPGTRTGLPEETGSSESSAEPAAESLPVARVLGSRASAQPDAASPSAERPPEKRTIERRPGNTPAVPGMWQDTQAPASSEGTGWSYLVIGLAVGVSIGTGAAWLLLRGRSGG